MSRQFRLGIRFALCGLFFGSLIGGCADGPDAPDPVDPAADPATDPSLAPTTTAVIAAPPATGRVASTDATAGAPTLLYADHEASPPPGRPTIAADAARWHVARFAAYYRLTVPQVADLELLDVHDTGRGAIIVRFARRVDGVEVRGERISVAMTRDLDVVAFTGYVTGDLPAAAKTGHTAAAFVVDAPRAIAAATSDLAGVALSAADFDVPTDIAGGYRAMRLSPAGRLRALASAPDPARAKPVLYRQGPGTLTAAYYVEADLGDSLDGAPRMFGYVIAADDGRVLDRRDLTAYEHPVSYRVYADGSGLYMPWDGPQGTAVTPHPTMLPDGFQPPFAAPQLVTLSSLTAVGVNDPWLPVGSTETLGNNADAYLDLQSGDGFTPGSADFRGVTTSPDTFDYAFDPGANADANVTQRLAAVTQLFFNINWLHDWYYAAGFTEASGNAQFSNYGRGGLEGDGIRAEAQDFGGFNNANMSTPADGNRPRMQMFLWTKPTQLNVTVTAPASLAGTFSNINTANFGPLNFSLAGAIVRANPIDGCAPLVGDYAGKIVVVDRGGPVECNGFAGKAQRVQAAGGIGAIIANVATSANPTAAPLMGGTPTVPVTIGAVSMNLADGDRFRAAFTAGDAVAGTVIRQTTFLDGDVDNQIVAHEWGHYISNRLVFDGGGLQNNMARGLGEGWADFHAILMTVRPEDATVPTNANWDGAYGMGAYATSSDPDSYYYGIRRYPYSTQLTQNPLTFRHISDANALPVSPPPNFVNANSEVHSTGEVWTAMLWECYAALLRDTTGASPRLTFAQARDRMRDYVVAAYKLTPAFPTLLEARDALILAATLGDPIDGDRFGVAFAKRGAGVRAVAPPRGENLNTPVVESYLWGSAIAQTGAALVDDGTAGCTADNLLDNGEQGTLRVTFKNVGIAATAATTATVSSPTTGISFPSGTTLTVPALARGASAVATVRVAAAGLPAVTAIALAVTTPQLAAGDESAPVTYTFSANADERAGASTTDTVERSVANWTTTSSVTNPTPDMVWQRTASSPSNKLWSARSASFASTSELVSPPIAMPVGGTLGLSFASRFSFERDAVNNLNFDGGVIEFTTDNGVTWTDVSTLTGTGLAYTAVLATGNPLSTRPAFTGTSANYPALATRTLNLGTGFGGKVVRLRFRVASDPGTASPGWEIDDIQITGGLVAPFHGLVPNDAGCNHQPVANVGFNQSAPETGPAPAFAPITVTLDGSASFDPESSALGFQWSQVAGPAVALSSATAEQPSFTAPPVPRTPVTQLVFQLVVTDGSIASGARQVVVTITNVNKPPVAGVPADQAVPEGALVTLVSTASTDPDGEPLTYLWTPPAGVTLSDPTAAQPTFTAPIVAATTPLVFGLRVSDGLATSATTSGTITVLDVNHAPSADAGAPQTVGEGTVVTLDASASADADGDPLAYTWVPPAGVTLSDLHAAQPTFTAPAVTAPTTLTFTVIVEDDAAGSSEDTVAITVIDTNHAPVADAGPPRTANEGALVTLVGTASSDPDGDALTYEWTAPFGVTLSSTTAATPTFTAPAVTATTTLTFFLVVRDPSGTASTPSTVAVTVNNVNHRPVAHAGADQQVVSGTVVTLDGNTSVDPDGDTLTYAWTAPAGVTLVGVNSPSPQFIAPPVALSKTFTFSLVVTDEHGAVSRKDTVSVRVRSHF